MPPFSNDWSPTDGEARALTFKPVGPVAKRFINDRMFIATVMGPYGSAKTTSCFQKIVNAAIWQNPGPDGVRRIRVGVIRATQAQLQTNVMDDWFGWFPKIPKVNWNGEENRHTVAFEVPGLGPLEIQMLFRGLGEQRAEQVFKGMALTVLWLNEVDTLDNDVLKFGLPRVGRYPQAKDGGCAWSGIICDMNAPDVDNWTYDLLVNKSLDIPDELMAQLREEHGPLFGISFHRQPGGTTPEAENLQNLPKGYYDRLRIGMSDNEIRRFVDNEFGAVSNGQPVYPEFIDNFHVARDPLKPVPGVPLALGIDGGSTPAIIAGQRLPNNQLRVCGELVVFNPDKHKTLAKMGPRQFGRMARDWIDVTFPAATVGDLWGDPAMFHGGYGSAADEDLSWAQDFGVAFGKRVRPSPVKGNRLSPRIETVRQCLTVNAGSSPGLLLSPTAKHLRQGFNNGYVIQRVKLSSGSGRWRDDPEKNDFSHAHDALQYLACGLMARALPTDDLDRRAAARPVAKVSYGRGYFSGRR